jgi:alpha-beta hydrolase superfamily lysophospholipase
VLDRAVIAWRVGKPHRAWEILAEAGMSDYWARFQRTALQHARRGYTRAMERYVA